ncbi:MAG: sigma-70 family RNA polymerase sigma factor [Angelakisella sp.]
MSDEECVEELKKENTQAIGALIDRYGAYVAKILYSFLGSGLTAQDLEEIASDVFFALWQQRHRLSENKSLKGYIGAIAKNTGRKRLRSLTLVAPLPEEFDLAAEELSPEETAELSEKRQRVLSLLAFLDKQDREIFYRYYFWEQTTGEIAKLTQLNRSTVMSKLARGRTLLKLKMGESQNEY